MRDREILYEGPLSELCAGHDEWDYDYEVVVLVKRGIGTSPLAKEIIAEAESDTN